MPDKLMLEVAAPDRLVIREEVDEVQIPAHDGSLGVLPGHAPLLTELGCGVMTFRQGDQRRYLAICDGFLEILPDHVRVLTNRAEWADEVDVERARVELRRAMDVLAGHDLEVELEQAQAEIALAQAKLQAHDLASGFGPRP